MANAEVPEPPQQPQKSSADEAARDRLENYSKILQDFVTSNNEVYEFEDNLPGQDRDVVRELCRKMGLGFNSKGIGGRRKVSVHNIKEKVSVHKIKEKVSNQAVTSKKRKREEGPEPHQRQNPIINVSSRIRISRILENFLASNDKVYKFGAYLSGEERALVCELSQKMGFKCGFSGLGKESRISVYKSKKKVDTATLAESLNESNQKRQKKEKPESQHLNPTVESTMIQVSQIFDSFVVSKDEVYYFEAKLSPEELAVVQQLSRKMGFKVEKSGKGKISVHKIKRKVGTITELESLSHFTFSEALKQVLGGLLMHYPPGDEEFLEEMIRTNTDTMDKTNQRRDDFFGRPCMSKADVAMKLEELAARMQNTSDLKPIVDKRSKLPIASFKDVIASTVDSHQVVLISGETGCGKTTQVPQCILDHMWGKGEVCKIVCTQPRRISAISVSERISCERGQTIGNDVGYKIRLESKGGRQSSIVLCTTGVLLKVLVSRGCSQLKTQVVKGGISGITHIIMVLH